MRSKNILSIAAFIIAFAFSAAFAGLFVAKSELQTASVVPVGASSQPTSCFTKRGRYTADKIEVFIAQDVSNGRDRDRQLYAIDGDYRPSHLSSSFPAYADAINEYADASNGLDETAMPHEFQIAWRAHMKAWRDYANYLDALRSSCARQKMSAQAAGEAENSFGADINATWYEVLRVGREYGAEVY